MSLDDIGWNGMLARMTGLEAEYLQESCKILGNPDGRIFRIYQENEPMSLVSLETEAKSLPAKFWAFVKDVNSTRILWFLLGVAVGQVVAAFWL
jgi:hypothetical protein